MKNHYYNIEQLINTKNKIFNTSCFFITWQVKDKD